MRAKVVAIIVLLSLLLIVAIQKTQPVVLNFLFWQFSPSSVLSILLSFIIGLLTGCLLMMIVRMKRKSPRLDYPFSNLMQFLFAQYYERILMGQSKSSKAE
jgi:uncharacterized integral membrane protein